MFRVSKGVAAGILAGTVLLSAAGQAVAQTPTTTSTSRTTSTSTSTTTTTTLLPHPFSSATSSCVRKARADFKACGYKSSECHAKFNTDFANCFAPGAAGVGCVTRCQARESTCLGGSKSNQKACNKSCVTTRRFDVQACRRFANGDDTLWATGDAGCITTALANFDLCRFICSEQKLFCRNAYRFCVANCANQ